MTNKNLQQWLDEDGIDIPLRSRDFPEGKTYHVDSPDYETGIRLQRIADLGVKVNTGGDFSEEDAKKLKLDDDQERDFSELVLGDALAEMVADGVRWGSVRRAVRYVFAYYTIGEDAAERLTDPKAVAPNRADRRAQAKPKKGSGKAR